MDWAQVLVIILAVFLAIFLVLAIVLTALVIKVTVQIKAITGVAQRTAEKIESVADNAAKFATPLAVFNLVSKYVKKSKSK